MQIIDNTLTDYNMDYPLDGICPLKDVLFLDIETTGFNVKTSLLYMIGCSFFDGTLWHVKQFFAENAQDEAIVLGSFAAFASSYHLLIHFNGNHFDIPYLQEKCRRFNISEDFSLYNGIDLYKRICPVRAFLKVPDCRQRTLEEFIGIERKMPTQGRDMISVYESYLLTPDPALRIRLLEHNFDDMTGMLCLTSLLAYSDLISTPQRVTKARTQRCRTYTGAEGAELIMKLLFTNTLPVPVSTTVRSCFFSGAGTDGYIKIPVYSETMKYFYANYKDYYYLPAEDTAIHKSIASFLDPSHRRQASATDCYTKKQAVFLPVWNSGYEPFFRRSYNSNESFIELTSERKTDREFFSEYARQTLEMMSCS